MLKHIIFIFSTNLPVDINQNLFLDRIKDRQLNWNCYKNICAFIQNVVVNTCSMTARNYALKIDSLLFECSRPIYRKIPKHIWQKNRTVSASCNFVAKLRWPQSFFLSRLIISLLNMVIRVTKIHIHLYYNSRYVSFEIGWQEVWWLLTLVFHRFCSSVCNPCYSISDKTLNMKRFNFYSIQFFLISP